MLLTDNATEWTYYYHPNRYFRRHIGDIVAETSQGLAYGCYAVRNGTRIPYCVRNGRLATHPSEPSCMFHSVDLLLRHGFLPGPAEEASDATH